MSLDGKQTLFTFNGRISSYMYPEKRFLITDLLVCLYIYIYTSSEIEGV